MKDRYIYYIDRWYTEWKRQNMPEINQQTIELLLLLQKKYDLTFYMENGTWKPQD